MMYVVKKGYTYLDTKSGRNTPYVGGQEFTGVIDETQKWKLGELKPVAAMPIVTKGVDDAKSPRKAEAAKTKTAKEIDEDEMDAGEE